MKATPNAASLALIDGDRVLLVRRAREPYRGFWTLPGGRLEPGENAEAGAVREIAEELGIRCSALRPVRLMVPGAGGFVLQVFATTTFAGGIVPSDEIDGFIWAGPADLAALRTTPGLGSVIAEALALFDPT